MQLLAQLELESLAISHPFSNLSTGSLSTFVLILKFFYLFLNVLMAWPG